MLRVRLEKIPAAEPRVIGALGRSARQQELAVTLPAGAVSDTSGNALAAPYVLTGSGIWFLGADANRNRVVNANNFTILASNFGKTGRTFSQGDFNYNGVVNANDFTILASRFGLALGLGVSGRAAPFGPRIGTTGADDRAILDELEAMLR